jgi:hypothetical protein
MTAMTELETEVPEGPWLGKVIPMQLVLLPS